jgi:hypothetical protein
MVRVAPEGYRPLADLAPHVLRALDDLCRRALAYFPAERFATAAEFAEAIEAAFHAEVATQRELAQFMSVVAADKLRVEREAARVTSQSVPPRPSRDPAAPPSMRPPAARPASRRPSSPGIDLRPPRLPDLGPRPAGPLRAVVDDDLVGSEDVTAIAHSTRPGAASTKPHPRPVTLPPLPRPSAPPAARASIAPRPDVDPRTLYEVATQAFPLQRPRPSLVPPAPAGKRAVEPELFRDLSVDDGRVSEVRIAIHAPAVSAPAVSAPIAEPPKLELPLLRPPAPRSLGPAPTPPAAKPGGFFSRLWSRLFGD